jgi:uncharacterized protein (DUF2062 family)
VGHLLQIDDPPRRIALGLSVGVFIGCTPLWGLQTLLSIVVAALFRLNRLATVTGAWLNLPWFAPFVYGAALKVGNAVVPDPEGVRAAWLDYLLEHPGSVAWHDVLALLEELSIVFVVGTLIVGSVAAGATYLVALAVISARRSRGDGASPGRRHAA